MNETMVTVAGNVVADPTLRATATGRRVAGFRLAATERSFDRKLNTWRDKDTTFWQVNCWGRSAENVADSLRKGQPVLVHGKVRVGTYEDKDGLTRTSLEIDAWTVGHDLTLGVAQFTKATVTRREETYDLETGAADDDSSAEQDGPGQAGGQDWGAMTPAAELSNHAA